MRAARSWSVRERTRKAIFTLTRIAGRVTFFADVTGVLTGDVPGAVLVDATGSRYRIHAASMRAMPPCAVFPSPAPMERRHPSARRERRRHRPRQRRVLQPATRHRSDAVPRRRTSTTTSSTQTAPAAFTSSRATTRRSPTTPSMPTVMTASSSAAAETVTLGASVLRNIVAGNGSGVRVQPNSFMGYFTGFNVVPDGFGGNTPRADSDFVPDKNVQLFVDPHGTRWHARGGSGFLDDDFHLVESSDNPALGIDYGEPNSLVAGSTRSDGLPDLGAADAGYHYPFLHAGPLPIVGAAGRLRARLRQRPQQRALARSGVRFHRTRTRGGIGRRVHRHRSWHLPRAAAAGRSHWPAEVVSWRSLGTKGDSSPVIPPGKVIVDAGGHAAPTVAGPALIDGLTLTGARGPGLRVLRGADAVTLRNSTLCGNTGDGVTTSGRCSEPGEQSDVRQRRRRRQRAAARRTRRDAAVEQHGRGEHATGHRDPRSRHVGVAHACLQQRRLRQRWHRHHRACGATHRRPRPATI